MAPKPNPNRALTAKQALFVVHYLADEKMNATNAALAAGYSPRNAAKYAHELMQLPHVKAAINAGIAKRNQEVGVDASYLLHRLFDEVEADMADIYDEDGTLKPIHQWPKVWRQGLVAGVDIEVIEANGTTAVRLCKVKFSDRAKRIEMFGKHVDVGAFRDKLDLTNSDGSLAPKAIDASRLSTEALKELMGAIDADEDSHPDGGGIK